jgi:hypothetical protein
VAASASNRAAKRGIRQFLVTTPGLGTADGVTVRSAAVTPEEFTGDMVILGDTTAPQVQAGLASRAKTPTVTCWVVVTRPGSGEAAIDAAGDRAEVLMALVEAALDADRTAAGSVLPPGQVVVTSSGLEESPVDWDSAAARRATIPFQLSWTSHIT